MLRWHRQQVALAEQGEAFTIITERQDRGIDAAEIEPSRQCGRRGFENLQCDIGMRRRKTAEQGGQPLLRQAL